MTPPTKARLQLPLDQQQQIQVLAAMPAGPAAPAALDQQLVKAIEDFNGADDRHSINRIEALLRQGASPNAIAADGRSVLHSAVKDGQLEIVRALCRFQADCTTPVNENGKTLLMLAAKKGHADIVEFLVKSQAMNVNGADSNEWTVLLYALTADDHDLDTIRKLLELGADVNIHTSGDITPIGMAAWDGNYEMLELLIRHGAKVDPESMGLWHALQGENPEIVNLLLHHGADPNTSGGDDPPLIRALERRYFAAISMLIAHNANVDWTENGTASAWTYCVATDPNGWSNADLLVARDLLINTRLPIFEAAIAGDNPRLMFQLISGQSARAELSRNGVLSLCAATLASEFDSFTERLRLSNNDQPPTVRQKQMLCAFLLATSPGLHSLCAQGRPNPYADTSHAYPERMKLAMFENTQIQTSSLIAYGERELARRFSTLAMKLESAIHELVSGAGIETLAQTLCEESGFPMRAAGPIAHCCAAVAEAMQPCMTRMARHVLPAEFQLRVFSTLFSAWFSSAAFHSHGEEPLWPGTLESAILEKVREISAPRSLAAASLLEDPPGFIDAICMKSSAPGNAVSAEELIVTICRETGIPYLVAILLADAWNSAGSGVNILSESGASNRIGPVFSLEYARILEAAIRHSDCPAQSGVLRAVIIAMKARLSAWCDAARPDPGAQPIGTAGNKRPAEPDYDDPHPSKRSKTF